LAPDSKASWFRRQLAPLPKARRKLNTEAGLYIESPELTEKLTSYMATGVQPANSYRVLLGPSGKMGWETVRDGQTVRYRDEPETGFRPLRPKCTRKLTRSLLTSAYRLRSVQPNQAVLATIIAFFDCGLLVLMKQSATKRRLRSRPIISSWSI